MQVNNWLLFAELFNLYLLIRTTVEHYNFIRCEISLSSQARHSFRPSLQHIIFSVSNCEKSSQTLCNKEHSFENIQLFEQ